MHRAILVILIIGLAYLPSCQANDDTLAKLPTDQYVSGLRSVVVPLKSVEMNSDDADLLALDTLIAGQTVVALGEVSHGSSDIFRMKGKLIKYLVTHKGFTIFSIEANMPEAYLLNNYIINGVGDPKELIKGMLFWTWDTDEMLAIVEWMKVYNQTHDKKVQFTGFDMQSYGGVAKAISVLLHKYQKDSIVYLQDLRTKLARLDSARRADTLRSAQKLSKMEKRYYHRQFQTLRSLANSSVSDKVDRDFFMRYVRVLEQYTANFSPSNRDKFMAENLMWIREQNKQAKIVVWAHNAHICRRGPNFLSYHPMGYYLKKKLKDDYLTVGFTYHEGSFTAIGKDGVSSYPAQKSYDGTYEHYFHSLNIPLFLIDLRAIRKEDTNAKLISKDMLFRWVGAVPSQEEFWPTSILDNFDLLVYIDSTRPSSLLHKRSKRK